MPMAELRRPAPHPERSDARVPRRELLRGAGAAMAAAAVGGTSPAHAAAGEIPGPTRLAEAVNVRDCGAAGDGKTDDTAALQKAISRAAQTSRCVRVPPGRYVTSKPLALEKVAVAGLPQAAWPADVDALPAILPSHRDGPAFELGAAGAMCGLDVTYRWAGEPEAGPAAVLVRGIGVFVRNVRIRYAWDGIVADGASNVGRANIENVFLVAVRNCGVRLTGTWDVPRLCNVEVWNAGPVPRGLRKGVGFHLGKNDLARLTDCFVFAMRHGFLLEDRIDGCKITGGTWGVMNGCATDYCGTGIELRGEHTLSVSGGTFWDHGSGLVVDGEKARVRVSGCELKSNGAPAVVVRRCQQTVVTGCSLLRPMKEHPGCAASLEGGRTVLSANAIESHGLAVRIGTSVRAAVVHANTLNTHGHDPAIDNRAPKAAVSLDGNIIASATPPVP